MNLDIETQDLYIPIGCRPTKWLYDNSLRFASLPLDLVSYIELDNVSKLLKNKFDSFLLNVTAEPDAGKSQEHMVVKDNIYNFFAIHHYRKDLPVNVQKTIVSEKYKKKSQKLIKLINKSKRVCFFVRYNFNLKQFTDFINSIEDIFKDINFTILNVENDDSLESDAYKIKKYRISNTNIINITINDKYIGSNPEDFSWYGNVYMYEKIMQELKLSNRFVLLRLYCKTRRKIFKLCSIFKDN